jgi:1-deoxyxylulose-5-phosphate synthase
MRASVQVAARRGIQPAQVAIAWLFSKPALAAPILGATKVAHLEAALAAVELKLDEEEIRQREAPTPSRVVCLFVCRERKPGSGLDLG